MIISLNKLSLSFGQQKIFDDLSLTINPHQKIGLVGRNGTGKSTLLKLINDAQSQPNAAISLAKHKKIGYLPQEVVLQSHKSILEEAFSTFDSIDALKKEAAQLEKEMEDTEDFAIYDRYAKICEQLQDFNPDKLLAETKQILMGLGFSQDQFDKPVDSLSVGWKMRIVLAKLLLQKADYYLFDEPTNHLDIVAKDWFLDFLKSSSFGFMIVCHERYFLNKLCDYIFELEFGKGTLYTGNYTRYETLKAEHTERLEKAHAEQQKEIKRKQETIDRFRAKASKAKMAQSMEKQLEKIELIELPQTAKSINISFKAVESAGRIVLTVKNLKKSFAPKTIFDKAEFLVERGEKVAVVAANGVGKTTLFNCIVGKLKADAGSIDFGHNVKHALFEQDQTKALDLNLTVLENIENNHPVTPQGEIRAMLGAFLFGSQEVGKKVKVLSGGEKNRVGMANVLLSRANVLFLDEPTNHLDMQSKEALLVALNAFPGTIIFVSHDHDFINQLASHVIELTPTGTHKYTGNYEEFLVQRAHAVHKNEAKSAAEKNNAPSADQETPHERNKRLKSIERKISSLEAELVAIQNSFAGLTYGTPAYKEAEQKLADTQKNLGDLQQEWEQLVA